MKPWNERVAERLAEGRQKYGQSTFGWDIQPLWEAIRDEVADVAGWAWVLAARAQGFPEADRHHVQLVAKSITRDSAVLWRALDESWVITPDGGPPFPSRIEPATSWLDRARTCRADLKVVESAAATKAWRHRVATRVAAGREKYGDKSFHSPPALIVHELADEVVSVALWTWVLAQRVSGSRSAALEDQLLAVTRGAWSMYHRLPALEMLLTALASFGVDQGSVATFGVRRWCTASSGLYHAEYHADMRAARALQEAEAKAAAEAGGEVTDAH